MSRLVVIVFISFLAFSCGSKKGVVTKKNKSEPVIERKEPVLAETSPKKPVLVKETSKVYANATEKYIDTYKEIAQNEMKLYGIPASITLAQGILESGSGKGRLSVKANNHFGIKCHDWTGKKIYHDDDKKGECFRKYNDAKYSFRDHSLFLSERKRYAFLFDLKQHDYKRWAKGLKSAGYATDRKYPEKLISLIERYKLYEYDRALLGLENNIAKDNESSKLLYTVSKGDTLYSISKKYNTTVQELQQINGLKGNDLDIGQILLVQQ
ncbi:glucosaminidase domain-containing protein [uncultured Algibacter sp.]|uniref:glucosaminidase domain-containing protein n=1 Tax=uncultured Algibacter sp. TaxID=298659 RepID=UPI0026096919|nr:glucosaminidase domain-containing protein [uncultured Algibacter sp.]